MRPKTAVITPSYTTTTSTVTIQSDFNIERRGTVENILEIAKYDHDKRCILLQIVSNNNSSSNVEAIKSIFEDSRIAGVIEKHFLYQLLESNISLLGKVLFR